MITIIYEAIAHNTSVYNGELYVVIATVLMMYGVACSKESCNLGTLKYRIQRNSCV